MIEQYLKEEDYKNVIMNIFLEFCLLFSDIFSSCEYQLVQNMLRLFIWQAILKFIRFSFIHKLLPNGTISGTMCTSEWCLTLRTPNLFEKYNCIGGKLQMNVLLRKLRKTITNCSFWIQVFCLFSIMINLIIFKTQL